MVIRSVFGDDSPYLTDLKKISFSTITSRRRGGAYTLEKRFTKGKPELLNLFNTMLEDLGLSVELSQNTTYEVERLKRYAHGMDKDKIVSELNRLLDEIDELTEGRAFSAEHTLWINEVELSATRRVHPPS